MTHDEVNQPTTENLRDRLEQLNRAIEEQETNLKAMIVPHNVWLQHEIEEHYEHEDGHIHSWSYYFIGMIKLRGTWRLCHAEWVTEYEPEPEEEMPELDWKPLVDASIYDRLAAAKHISALREAILECHKKLIPKVDKAIEILTKQPD
jgi:hypothetical protein